MPSDIAVSATGRIYVVDGVNHAVRVYSSQGKHLFSFGSKGSGDGQLNYPLGIDIDSSGKVYVADSGNHRVQVFSAEGGFIAKISIPSDKAHPADPTDVAVDESRNRCYVVDNDNHRIVVLNLSDFSIGRSYGSPGNEKLNFRYPFQMALDKDNYLFIVDVINTRVQVLNPEGRFVAYIGGWGIAKALEKGADIVVGGRIADASMVLGPAAWYFKWRKDDWDKLAGSVTAGHIIECPGKAGYFSGANNGCLQLHFAPGDPRGRLS